MDEVYIVIFCMNGFSGGYDIGFFRSNKVMPMLIFQFPLAYHYISVRAVVIPLQHNLVICALGEHEFFPGQLASFF